MTYPPIHLPLRLYICGNQNGTYLITGFLVKETKRRVGLVSMILDVETSVRHLRPDIHIEKKDIIKEVVLAA